VTGVGRREGIGFAIARRLLDDGRLVLGNTVIAVDPGPVDTGPPGSPAR
jgi:hypothetical protein